MVWCNRILSPCKGGAAPTAVTQHCADCKGAFTVVVRKHRCRQCGSAFCGQCSSTFSAAGVKAERSCLKCATKGLLLRRKAKAPAKKLGKVVKSSEGDKLDAWENVVPGNAEPSQSGSNVNAKTEGVGELVQHEGGSSNAADPRPASVVDAENDEDAQIQTKGLLCILPPSLYSYVFGPP
jgi:DNA-directed RNA polymerase subunit RPC12/RpoP